GRGGDAGAGSATLRRFEWGRGCRRPSCQGHRSHAGTVFVTDAPRRNLRPTFCAKLRIASLLKDNSFTFRWVRSEDSSLVSKTRRTKRDESLLTERQTKQCQVN